jgi:hypothetical protein
MTLAVHRTSETEIGAMALRAAERAKKPTAGTGSAKSKSSLQATDGGLCTVPLELAPMLAPHRKRGRLSLRIEHLPQRARFSAGRNNGDNSWSLATDELEDLEYSFPEHAGEHRLTIRLVGLDQEGATIAVLEVPVVPGETRITVTAPDSTSDALTRLLRHEVESLKTILAARDAELAEARGEAHKADTLGSEKDVEAALMAARVEWKMELDRLLAAAESRSARKFEDALKTSKSENGARIAELAEQAEKQLAEARKQWQHESETALAKARKDWQADQAGRVAEVETRLQKTLVGKLAEAASRYERAEKALADLRKESVAAKSQHDSAGQRQLRGELESAKTALAEREKDLAKAVQSAADARKETTAARSQHESSEQQRLRTELESARTALAEREKDLEKAVQSAAEAQEEWRRRSEAAFANAKKEWEAADAQRRKSDEARWQETLAKKLDEVRRQSSNAKLDRESTEAQRLRGELETARAALGERDEKLADELLSAARAQKQWRQDSEAALSEAKRDWESAETAKIATIEARWQGALASKLNEAGAKCERAESELADAQSRLAATDDQRSAENVKLRVELETARTAISERDRTLAETVQLTEQARVQWRRDSEAALAGAKRSWEDGESGRIAAAEAQWRATSSTALTEATSRYKEAEKALAQIRVRADAEREAQHSSKPPVDGAGDIDSEIPRHRSKAATALSPRITLRTNDVFDDAQPDERKPRTARRLVRDMIVVGCFAVAAVAAFPFVVPYIPDEWRAKLGLSTSETQAPADDATNAQLQATPAAVNIETATVVRSANVRADAFGTAKIIATLPRHAKVQTIDQTGGWTHVRIPGTQGKLQDGWVFSTFLKPEAGSEQK